MIIILQTSCVEVMCLSKICGISWCVGVPAEHLWNLLYPSLHPSIHPYVCTHKTTQQPLNGLWNLLLKNFKVTYWVNFVFHLHRIITMTTLHGDLHVCICACVIFSLLCACAFASTLWSEEQVLSRACSPVARLRDTINYLFGARDL
jgi:hypothetical protein